MKKILLLTTIMFLTTVVFASQVEFIEHIDNKQFKHRQTDYTQLVQNVYEKQTSKMQRIYSNIRYKTIYNPAGNADHIIVIKNSKYQKGFTLDRININESQQLTENYKLTTSDIKQMSDVSTPHCPDSNVTFVVSSYNYSNPLRKVMSSPALDQIVFDAEKAGYNVVTLYDDKATSQAILNYLSCPNVTGYHDVGDGSPSSIETSDGLLTASDVNQYLQDKLKGKTIYLNDCLVAEASPDSIKDAIMNNGAQVFLGGITVLAILTTDTAGACFWHQAMQHKNMQTANSFCQDQYDYEPFGSDGITGYYSNGNDKLPGIKQKLDQQSWGAIGWGVNFPGGYSHGETFNVDIKNDNKSANQAKKHANILCVQNGGQSCSQLGNYVQFQHCVAMYLNHLENKVYYGFGASLHIAKQQAKQACPTWNVYDKKNCTYISGNCNAI